MLHPFIRSYLIYRLNYVILYRAPVSSVSASCPITLRLKHSTVNFIIEEMPVALPRPPKASPLIPKSIMILAYAAISKNYSPGFHYSFLLHQDGISKAFSS